jgi:hypothetical protein
VYAVAAGVNTQQGREAEHRKGLVQVAQPGWERIVQRGKQQWHNVLSRASRLYGLDGANESSGSESDAGGGG